jgi:predicted lipase
MDYQTARQCALISQDIYQDFSDLKFRAWTEAESKFVSIPSSDTQMAILNDRAANTVILVFRGSSDSKDWETNLELGQSQFTWTTAEKQEYREQVVAVKQEVAENRDLIYPEAYAQSTRPVTMHAGFMNAYLSVRNTIHGYLRNGAFSRCIVTGHSLGGALATLCSIDVQYNFGQHLAVEVYTFGAPKVGNAAFVESYNRRVPDSWRFVYGWDAVVGLPRWWQGYRHVNRELKLERGFTWRIISGRFQDHQITNYIRSLTDLTA